MVWCVIYSGAIDPACLDQLRSAVCSDMTGLGILAGKHVNPFSNEISLIHYASELHGYISYRAFLRAGHNEYNLFSLLRRRDKRIANYYLCSRPPCVQLGCDCQSTIGKLFNTLCMGRPNAVSDSVLDGALDGALDSALDSNLDNNTTDTSIYVRQLAERIYGKKKSIIPYDVYHEGFGRNADRNVYFLLDLYGLGYRVSSGMPKSQLYPLLYLARDLALRETGMEVDYTGGIGVPVGNGSKYSIVHHDQTGPHYGKVFRRILPIDIYRIASEFSNYIIRYNAMHNYPDLRLWKFFTVLYGPTYFNSDKNSRIDGLEYTMSRYEKIIANYAGSA